MNVKWNAVWFVALLAGVAQALVAQAQGPVKVFVLAGQSNMQGHGWYDDTTNNGIDELGTLRKLVQSDPANYGHLLDGNNNWVTRSDVNIFTVDGNRSGGLTVGYGVNSSRMGPELGFGTVVGDTYTDDVLIIKTSWGGKSLAVDFLSPTAAARHGRDVGEFYTQMLTEVDDVLSNIGSFVPGYAGQGYELKGFGWHQGWNDRVNGVFVSEYEANLVDFINDVRFDLRASDLPFVVANTGIDGNPLSGPALNLANAQLGVANLTLAANQNNVQAELLYPEFVGNVMGVNTIPFWRAANISPITNGSQGFHWNQNGETHYLMGEAMGEAMATMSSYVQFERSYLTVDQQTGEIKLVNPSTNLEDMDLKAYTITSAAGALNAANWTSIAGNYDGAGDDSVDSGNWMVDAATTSELSESAVAGGDDGLIAIDNQVSLGVGAWIQNLEKDLVASYTDTDGNVIDLNIRYLGFDNILGDLTSDGVFDVADWAQFKSGIQLDMTGLSAAQAYQLGDLDGDFDNDIDDFGIFRNLFEQNTPPGTLEAILAGSTVPEPSSVMLFLAGALGLLFGRRRVLQPVIAGARSSRLPNRSRNNPLVVAVAIAAALFAADKSFAQEMFSVNLWSVGKPSSPSVWVDTPANVGTLTLSTNEAAGLFETTNWRNIDLGNPFNTSTSVTTIHGSSGSTATFSMPQRRNSSPFHWNTVRNDSDTVHVGNATLLDAHAVGTEDPYDESATAILQVSNIPFPVYDVVIYLGINDGQKFQGKGTINFDGAVQQFTMPITEPNGTLTRILNSTTPGNYFHYEQVTGSSFTAEIWGDAFTHLGPAGFQIVEVVDPTQLSLQVNRATGEMAIMGDSESDYDFNYYQITSAGNSLKSATWLSLADQDYEGNGPVNGSGNGWEEGGGLGSHALAEGFLLGNSTIVAGAELGVGEAYDTTVDARDLVFKYRSGTGQVFEGMVDYINVLTGDYNGNGIVDAADYTVFRDTLGNMGPNLSADGNGDMVVDAADYALWRTHFGKSLAPPVLQNATGVPEPSAIALVGLFVLSLRLVRWE